MRCLGGSRIGGAGSGVGRGCMRAGGSMRGGERVDEVGMMIRSSQGIGESMIIAMEGGEGTRVDHHEGGA